MPPGGQFRALLDLRCLSKRNLDIKALLACFDILPKRYVHIPRVTWHRHVTASATSRVGVVRTVANALPLRTCNAVIDAGGRWCQRRYVERVQAILFADPPMIFYGAWRVVQPFVAAATREKISFVFGPAVGTTLLEHYDAADIPVEYGGTGALRPVTAGPAVWEAPGAPRLRQY